MKPDSRQATIGEFFTLAKWTFGLLFKIEPVLPLLILFMITLVASTPLFQNTGNNWQKAGNISMNVLTDLKVSFENLKKTSNIYFVNLPTYYNNVPVYSVGISDSLWFIYQANNPKVYTVPSINDANNMIIKNKTIDNYIFDTQQDGRLKLVQ